MKECVGYLQMPVQWFDTDPLSNDVRTFFVYATDGQLEPIPELRQLWLSCIQPVYANPSDSLLIHYYDTKSNPRRVHPFAVVYWEWCNKVYDYMDNPHLQQKPVCVLKRCVLPGKYSFRFREDLPPSMEYWINYSHHDGLPSLMKLQSWCRQCLAQRVVHFRRMDPEVLFSFPPGSRERIVRFSKLGIRPSTYETMSASPHPDLF